MNYVGLDESAAFATTGTGKAVWNSQEGFDGGRNSALVYVTPVN